ncbi:MAG: hypothetical protein WDN69_14970 [Aliidongia sp.]
MVQDLAATDQALYLGAAQPTAGLGDVFPLGLRRKSPDGSFDGVIGTVLTTAHFGAAVRPSRGTPPVGHIAVRDRRRHRRPVAGPPPISAGCPRQGRC